MSQFKQNFKKEKYTTGTGIAMLGLLALKAFKIDLGEMVGVSTGDLAITLGTVVSAVMLLFAKDPKQK